VGNWISTARGPSRSLARKQRADRRSSCRVALRARLRPGLARHLWSRRPFGQSVAELGILFPRTIKGSQQARRPPAFALGPSWLELRRDKLPPRGSLPRRSTRPEGWSAKAGGKSELRRAVRRVTPGRGNPKDSGTENIPPAFAPSALQRGRLRDRQGACFAVAPKVRRRVRVKRCGKSAPRSWQHGWQAKPRTEQDQIRRPAVQAAADGPSAESPGRSLDLASNGEARGMVVISPKAGTEFGLRLAAIFSRSRSG